MPWSTRLPVEVEPLAERLHDELLQIAAEQQQPILVGQDDHVLPPLAAGGVVPHQREQRGRVLAASSCCGSPASHAAAPASMASIVDALQRRGHQADRPSSLVRPPTQSHIGNRASQPSVAACLSSCEPVAGDGDGVLGEVEPAFLIRVGGHEHAVARFRRAAALGDHERQASRPSLPSSRSSTRAMPSGSVLSMKWTAILSVPGSPSASATNSGPSAEPPMPIESNCVNLPAFGGLISPACTSAANALMRVDRVADLSRDLRRRRELRGPQPVVPDHPLLVRVGDRALFERRHVAVRLLQRRLHFASSASLKFIRLMSSVRPIDGMWQI